jgi:chorismate mutase/ribosomal protein S18 acetylase RimI-like enzyme
MRSDEGRDTDALSLRPATEDDVEALTELFLRAREAAVPSMPPTVHGREAVRSWFAERLGPRPVVPDVEAWVAEQEAEPVGYLLLERDWLDSLYVAPGRTGEGIGSALLDLAKSLRPDGFGLWVFETNTRAQAFYRRHGVVTVRSTDGAGNEERAPDRQMAWLGADPLTALRRRIDAADDELADVLEQRAALTALIQRYKDVPGEAGRDPAREREIAERMGRRAPRLGPDRMHRIMQAVIAEGLAAADEEAPGSTVDSTRTNC